MISSNCVYLSIFHSHFSSGYFVFVFLDFSLDSKMNTVQQMISLYFIFGSIILASLVLARENQYRRIFPDYDNDLSLWIDEAQVKRFSGEMMNFNHFFSLYFNISHWKISNSQATRWKFLPLTMDAYRCIWKVRTSITICQSYRRKWAVLTLHGILEQKNIVIISIGFNHSMKPFLSHQRCRFASKAECHKNQKVCFNHTQTESLLWFIYSLDSIAIHFVFSI